MLAAIARWRQRRETRRARRVLAVLLLREVLEIGGTSGWPLMKATGHGGSVYVVLAALERDGYVTSEWEPRPPGAPEDKPRRRLYRLSGTGRAHAQIVVSRWLQGEEA